ncbi:Cell death protease [Podila epigama]|nr:Cell death protease [Podila epigama]
MSSFYKALLALATLAQLATITQAQTQDYLVTNLPGLSAQDAEQLTQYAGHIELEASLQSKLFFWLVQSKTITKKSKLILWLNGGPGCSSADGYFLEGGPVRFENGALTLNKGAWHEFANVLFVDQPVGTGFSITSNQLLSNMDEITTHFMAFLKAFFAVFPDRATDDLYLAGESYAGTYIPYFAKAILEHNEKQAKQDQVVNLQGLIIGNGWTDPVHQYTSYIPFAQKYNISTPKMLESMESQMNVCLDAIRTQDKITQDACEELVNIILKTTLSGYSLAIYISDLYVTDENNSRCYNQYDIRLTEDYPSCGLTWPHELPLVKQYLDRADVKAALHATEHKGEWRECNSLVNTGLRFDDSLPAVTLLPDILSKIKVLLYSGQQDLICNHLGTEYMIANMTWEGKRGFQDASKIGWTVDDKPAGEWQIERNLSYALIYNSSHMVPYDVPVVTLDMINRFIGIDHKLEAFNSKMDTDIEEVLPPGPPGGAKQDIVQPSYSVNGSAVLILTVIAVCVAVFVTVRNNKRKKRLGGNDGQWFPLDNSYDRGRGILTDDLDELVVEGGIINSDDDEDYDEEEDRNERR